MSKRHFWKKTCHLFNPNIKKLIFLSDLLNLDFFQECRLLSSRFFGFSRFAGRVYFLLIQVSKIVDCKLKYQHELSFEFSYGSCNTFDGGYDIWLCFDVLNYKQCHM